MRAKCVDYVPTLIYLMIFVVNICTAFSTSNGKGIYQTYNTKKFATSPAMKKESEKIFFGLTNDHSRAPSHDTPASPCTCSKCYFFLCKLISIFSLTIWILIFHSFILGCGVRNDASRIVGYVTIHCGQDIIK